MESWEPAGLFFFFYGFWGYHFTYFCGRTFSDMAFRLESSLESISEIRSIGASEEAVAAVADAMSPDSAASLFWSVQLL